MNIYSVSMHDMSLFSARQIKCSRSFLLLIQTAISLIWVPAFTWGYWNSILSEPLGSPGVFPEPLNQGKVLCNKIDQNRRSICVKNSEKSIVNRASIFANQNVNKFWEFLKYKYEKWRTFPWAPREDPKIGVKFIVMLWGVQICDCWS